MSILVNWGDPTRETIHLQFERGWTWDDLHSAISTADAMLESVPHEVHLIIDVRSSGLPRDFLNMAKELFAEGEARPNEGQRIVVGAGPLMQAAYQGLQGVYGAQLSSRPFRFARNLEAAHDMLQRQP